MKLFESVFIVFFLCAFVTTSIAQKDIAGSKDHPLISRYPGSFIASYEDIKYREYSLATGPVTGYRFIEKKQTVAGQLYRITYLLKKDVKDLSIGEVYLDYKKALQEGKVEILAEGLFSDRNVKKQAGGSSWIGVALKDNGFTQDSYGNYLFKGTSSSGGTFSLIGKSKRKDGDTFLAIYGERHSKDVVVVHVDIIEVKNAETGKVFADANYIKQELEESGKVIIYGINFDFDSATIREDSKATLDEIATYLKNNRDVNIYLVGHTDLKGTLTYNKKLSLDRAKATVEKLIREYKISRVRLEAEGVGPLAPVASNDTEEGRALNRRVELVKKLKNK